ncbi:M24 family metallopeptidase [Naumannella sp. ID2617S]|nr:M24 family metallopeptidase [Naumannella sp. ID2617S]
MAAAGLDALLVSDPANLYYLTGYQAWSFYTPQFLYVPAEGELLLVAREMDAAGATRTCWLPSEQIVGYPETLVHVPDRHPFDWVADEFRRRGLVGPARVGLESDSHFFSPKAYLSLVAGFGEWELVDCHELVNWVRSVKSTAEIDLMRAAARVTTRAMQAAIDTIEVGVPQHVVAAEVMRAQALGDGEIWGDFPAIVPMLPTGAAADTPHLTWSDQRLTAGDAVVVELAGAHRRYHVPLARTVMLGKPSTELRRTEECVAEGLAAVLDAIAPGVEVASVAEAWNTVLARYGLEKRSRLGYSIGIGYPPDWGERTISIRSGETPVLAENMTFHIICGMWMTGYGYEVSESVRVAADGVETFTNFPRALIAKG